MRIAQVAPLYESVPPKYYGGTERVVSYLTEELVRQGHEVTLFASGDSETNARLVAACRRSVRHAGACFPARARVRHHSFSGRLPAFPAQPKGGGYTHDHVTWADGYAWTGSFV